MKSSYITGAIIAALAILFGIFLTILLIRPSPVSGVRTTVYFALWIIAILLILTAFFVYFRPPKVIEKIIKVKEESKSEKDPKPSTKIEFCEDSVKPNMMIGPRSSYKRRL